MKSRILVFMLLMVLGILPVLAQNTPPTTNSVSFNGFSFNFDSTLASNVNISQMAGTDPDQPLGLNAAHTEFVLSGADAVSVTAMDAPVVIQVYQTADLAGMEAVQGPFQELQSLLSARSDLATGGNVTLQFLPLPNAAQTVVARAQYIDTASLQGVSYITAFHQDMSSFTGSEFVYTFQGLSLDGTAYVSAVFHLNTDLFPADSSSDFTAETFPQYVTESAATLNNAEASAFTPSLTDVETVIRSMSFASMITPTPVAAVPTMTMTGEAPTVAATDVTDPTLGGLAGTWTLVSYGPAEAQIPALANAPITISFAPTGLSGSAGCNTYGGSFQYNAGALTFTNVVSTLMACADDINAQEATYLGALGTVSAFQVNGGQLLITYEGGVLTFTNGAPTPTATVTVDTSATPTTDPAVVPTLDPAVPTVTLTATP
jgi:heat shock protein HslJ